MTSTERARQAVSGRALPSLPPVCATAITSYGCGLDEAELFRAIAPRYGVTLHLTEAALSENNVALAAGKRCISVSHKSHVTNATLRALSEAGVRYISTRSVGRDHINVGYAENVGITVGNVVYSPDSVADYTLMLMLMTVRHAKSTVRRAATHDYRLSDVRGRELRDLTIGVIGTGRIGNAVIARLRGFGSRIVAYDRCRTSDVDYLPIEELLRCSDIVTLHTALDASTHHLLDRQRIAEMKPGAILVNTARGSLVDTAALLSGLESGRLGGAALDVLEDEEGIFYTDCRATHVDNAPLLRLQKFPNVVVSPHTAYYTDHALADIVENTVANCVTFEKETKAWIG